MTEEIIIDGVNVAGCQYLFDDTSYKRSKTSCSINLGDCKKRPFERCDYKQRKRLEQENFVLTQESQQKSQTICELEQENKELKEKLDKEEYNACCECTNIQNQNDKYKSALKEIRKIAKGISKSTIDTYPYGGDEKTWEAEEAERILEKITEVLQ